MTTMRDGPDAGARGARIRAMRAHRRLDRDTTKNVDIERREAEAIRRPGQIQCPNCAKYVPEGAVACDNCGENSLRRIQSKADYSIKSSPWGRTILGVIALFAIVAYYLMPVLHWLG